MWQCLRINLFFYLALFKLLYTYQLTGFLCTRCVFPFMNPLTEVSKLIKIVFEGCSEISNTTCLPKRPGQTAQTQSRMLMKQSDQ